MNGVYRAFPAELIVPVLPEVFRHVWCRNRHPRAVWVAGVFYTAADVIPDHV
jgi:hypothetical protein